MVLSALIYFFYIFVEDQITGNLESEAANTSSLFAGAIRGDLQRHLIVPRILSRDSKVANGQLNYDPTLNEDFTRTVEELDRATLYMVNRNGVVINSSDPNLLNTNFAYPEYAAPALQIGNVFFFDIRRQVFVAISRVEDSQIKTPLGILVMEVAFAPYPARWERLNVNMLMMREDGTILASRNVGDLSLNLREIIGQNEDFDLNAIRFKQSYEYHDHASYLYVTDLGINGWKLVYAVPALEARQLINGIVALAVFALAFLMLLVLYAFSRRTARQSTHLKRESEELRALNARLLTEVEQRRRAEENLQSAEQSLEQSQKLAVIGQLSAAVGHELNQPLAAMRTYLMTIRMLLRRSRFFEAAQNLNRVDDLVDRMSSITSQMRSFARAHENENMRFSLNDSIINAFQLMTPQLGQRSVEIEREIPQDNIYVQGDRIRVEQILVNVLRNAIEAVEHVEMPTIKIRLIEKNNFAHIYVIDNGSGISQPEQLFEPFYTTKEPGKGLGLGLAISASYARDMGGNLLARNNGTQGATFELILPVVK